MDCMNVKTADIGVGAARLSGVVSVVSARKEILLARITTRQQSPFHVLATSLVASKVPLLRTALRSQN